MSYLFKTRGFKFFETVLITASLFITITVIRNSLNSSLLAYYGSTSYSLKSGWNLLTIPYSNYSAKKLCDNYNFEEIAKWTGNSWKKYNCLDTSAPDFPVSPNKAFFVKQWNGEYNVTFSGNFTKNKSGLVEGWNSVDGAETKAENIYASDYCSIPNKNGLKITGVARWAFGKWITHTCGVDINNFPIMNSETYFVKVENPKLPTDAESTNLPMMLVTPE